MFRILLLEAGGENPFSIYGSVPAFAIFMQKGEADWQYVTEGHESAMGHLQDGVRNRDTTCEADGILIYFLDPFSTLGCTTLVYPLQCKMWVKNDPYWF